MSGPGRRSPPGTYSRGWRKHDAEPDQLLPGVRGAAGAAAAGAKLASSYGRDWFTEKARAGEKTTELWLDIAKSGSLGINIPEEYGGGGGGIGDIAAVCEELAAQGCPLLLMVVARRSAARSSTATAPTSRSSAGCPASATAPARWRSRSPSRTPAPTRTPSRQQPAESATSGCSTDGRSISPGSTSPTTC